jgi:hypothetical protein
MQRRMTESQVYYQTIHQEPVHITVVYGNMNLAFGSCMWFLSISYPNP